MNTAQLLKGVSQLLIHVSNLNSERILYSVTAGECSFSTAVHSHRAMIRLVFYPGDAERTEDLKSVLLD